MRSRSSMVAAIAVEDVQEASALYQRLGFTLDSSRPGTGGPLEAAWLRQGSATLLLGPLEARTPRTRQGPRGLGVTLVLEVPDIEPLHAVVKETRLPILLAPVDEYYGYRVFRFLDPYGYEWKVQHKLKRLPRRRMTSLVGAAFPTVP